jgi:hypothetical protein
MRLSTSASLVLCVCAAAGIVVGCSSSGWQLAPTTPNAGIAPDTIVYHPANVTIENTTYGLSLKRDGKPEFQIEEDNDLHYGRCKIPIRDATGVLKIVATKLGGVMSTDYLAAALASGSPIGQGSGFSSYSLMQSVRTIKCGLFKSKGNWYRKSAYLGLAFAIRGQTHYGWAHFSVTKPLRRGWLIATLKGFAYQSKAGKSIMAGQQ